eukprot:TRINITY_DN7803_c0_g1_i1.p1 TRINITY_DN7803_c0_g1~~TRINITY_DN7803_c0_g1_i1.p1  ORF type:complete len:859 (+),score=173.19 TRINITY_DN7803_c0_g1_i1:95-2578(+)
MEDPAIVDLGIRCTAIETKFDNSLEKLAETLNGNMATEKKSVSERFAEVSESARIQTVEAGRLHTKEMKDLKENMEMQMLLSLKKMEEAMKPRFAQLTETIAASTTQAADVVSEQHKDINEIRSAQVASEAKIQEELRIQTEVVDTRLRAELASQAEEIAKLQAELDEARVSIRSTNEKLRLATETADRDTATARSEAKNALSALADAMDEKLVELRASLIEELRPTLFKDVENHIEKGLADIHDLNLRHMDNIDLAVEAHGSIVSRTAWLVENMYTRSITWRVPGFKKKLFALLQDEGSYLVSPCFSVQSLPEFAMELQVSQQPSPTPPLPGAANMPVPGMCSMRLWAPPGLYMVFRVCTGEGPGAVSRRYEHTFQESDASAADAMGRVHFEASNICQLTNTWNRKTDTASFGFELVEFRFVPTASSAAPRRFIPPPVEGPLSAQRTAAQSEATPLASAGPAVDAQGAAVAARSPAAASSRAETGQIFAGSPGASEATRVGGDREEAADGDAIAPEGAVGEGERDVVDGDQGVGNTVEELTPEEIAERARQEEERLRQEEENARMDAEIAEKLQDIVVGDPLGTGDISSVRYATSEMVLQEKLQKDLQAYKNKSVRRVEWKLEGCARLLELCGPGQGVDSPLFDASGVHGLRLHFYPRGSDPNATGGASGQWCGLFVSGPMHCTLHGVLWVGNMSKSFEHAFQRRGDAGGRGRFCNLANQLDCDDCILLALDITQIETALPDSSAVLILRDARTSGPNNAAGLNSTSGSVNGSVTHPSPVAGTKGVLRMKREDPTKTEECARCVSLPTLNSRQHYLPLVRKSQRSR